MSESTNSEKKMVFRQTHRVLGRQVAVTPANSTNKHLCYGRIVLDSSLPLLGFSNNGQETGLICLSGSANVMTGGKAFSFEQYDSIYIPRDSEIEVATASRVDFAEFSAEVANRYPLHFVPLTRSSRSEAQVQHRERGQHTAVEYLTGPECRGRTAAGRLYDF